MKVERKTVARVVAAEPSDVHVATSHGQQTDARVAVRLHGENGLAVTLFVTPEHEPKKDQAYVVTIEPVSDMDFVDAAKMSQQIVGSINWQQEKPPL